ncbi:hypothetical protein BKA93DRAFT_818229 [Sparassis latifolia]
MDIESLSVTQKEALSQLQALMDGGDQDVAIGVLQSAGWDVQRAAEIIFDHGTPASAPVSRPPVEEFEIDDSEQGLLIPNGRGREFRPIPASSSVTLARPLRAILSVLVFPLRILTSIIRFIFRVLHIPLSQFAPFTFSNLTFTYRQLPGTNRDRKAMDSKSVVERWVRALEEETGAVCVSRSGTTHKNVGTPVTNGHGLSSGTAAGVAGPSSLTSRPPRGVDGEADGETKLLPDFFLGSYEQFVRSCERDVRIGCVVLVSEEHDDVAEFKRQAIQENDILVWGGDIRDREAWSASQKLQATTYPFVAFIALQARRGTASSTSPVPTLTILSRHQGPAIPSTSAPTAAQSLVTHLNEHLLPRVTPFLARVRTQAAEREHERALRAEQDRAFEETRRRDKERVERRLEEEKRSQVEHRLREEAEQRERAERERAEERRRAYQARRMEWRRYARKALVLREPRPGETGRGKTLRVGLRMPDGRRAVRFFGEGDPLTALYAYVDSLFIPLEFAQDKDPFTAPAGVLPGEAGLVEEVESSRKSKDEWWGFKLVLAYPRKEIVWEPAKRLGDVEALKGGGQVVVEMVSDVGVVNGKGKRVQNAENGVDSDGYATEESE